MPREERRSIGSGSGVIFSSDGYIITNAHVIADADEIEVVHKKQRYQAELVGKNLATDLALIKIKAKGLPKVVIGSSQKLRVGDWVIAIGNPFNLNSTVTAGIVSAKGRRINILKDVFPIESFIQTDAAINPGNSGGGLLNKKGELVGINTAILSQTGSYSGYGFAVPSDIVVKVFKDLKAYGEIQKAFLGCEVKEIDSDVAQRLNIDTLQGVAVISLIKEGAAYKSNVELGDVILQINDYQINSQADYDEILSISSPGDTVTLTVRKQNGSTQIKYPILTNSEGTTELGLNKNYKSKYLGGTLAPLPRLEQVQLEVNGGVKVKEVQDGILKNMELEEGFIIMSINGYTVNSPQEFEKIVKEIYGTVVVELIDKNGQRNRYRFRFN